MQVDRYTSVVYYTTLSRQFQRSLFFFLRKNFERPKMQINQKQPTKL